MNFAVLSQLNSFEHPLHVSMQLHLSTSKCEHAHCVTWGYAQAALSLTCSDMDAQSVQLCEPACLAAVPHGNHHHHIPIPTRMLIK